MSPELLAIGRERIAQFAQAGPGLSPYRQALDNVLRAAPHTLDAAGESIVATYQPALNQSSSLYQMFTNAELPWPTVTLADGTSVKVDHAGYERHRQSRNRDDRKKVMDAFFGAFKGFERTLGVAF